MLLINIKMTKTNPLSVNLAGLILLIKFLFVYAIFLIFIHIVIVYEFCLYSSIYLGLTKMVLLSL